MSEPASGAAAGPETAAARPPARGLVVQTAFPGDVILTTPLIRRAAERLASPVDVVVTPGAAPALENNPHIRDVIVFDKSAADRGMRGLWRTVRRLKENRYEVSYHAQASARSALLAFLAGIPQRIGLRGAPGAFLYTRTVTARGEPHQVERLLQLADGAPDVREPEIFPGEADRMAADALLAEAGIASEFVALAPGSHWATKRWPYFAELARALAAEIPVAIVGGPGDRAEARAIRDALVPLTPVADGAGRLSLLASGHLIARARLLVSNDSAPVHLASAVGTATLEIYGPTVPRFGFSARASGSRVVEPDPMSCRPCDKHGPAVCPLGHHNCMREISVGRVLAEARTMLQIVRKTGGT